MRRNDYRLVVRSDGEALHIRVEGDADAARGQLSEVDAAATKFGIPVHVTKEQTRQEETVPREEI